MDHLDSEKARRARWYARHIEPRCIPVVRAKVWQDLLGCEVGEDEEQYSFVYSVPFSWLQSEGSLEIKPCAFSDEIARDLDNTPNPIRTSLQKHGFVVVSGVLSAEDCQAALDRAWDWMVAVRSAEDLMMQREGCGESTAEKLSSQGQVSETQSDTAVADFSRAYSDPKGATRIPETNLQGGIYSFFGAGHSSLAWFVRSHDHVRRVFASLYGLDQTSERSLISSLDGIVLWQAIRQNTPDKTSDDDGDDDIGWFHIDQHPVHKPHACSVQGLVNLLPVTKYTGGNVLVAQSHHLFAAGHYVGKHSTQQHTTTIESVDEFYRQRLQEVGEDDWLEIDPHDDELLGHNRQRILLLLLSAGDVLLWDSRVVHCSYPGHALASTRSTNDTPNDSGLGSSAAGSLIRAATLVSMIPDPGPTVLTPQIRRERRQAVQDRRTLTHWVTKASVLGHEQAEAGAQDRARTACLMSRSCQSSPVLLGWDDLTSDQKRLVVGDEMYLEKRHLE